MRVALVAGVIGCLALGALPATAQTSPASPAELTILIPEVEARSGPSKEFYPTIKLRQGEKVQVVNESKEQPGWVAIKPPPGSFSWINARFVQKQPDGRLATVISDVPVPVMPGSSLTNQAPNVEQTKVERGTLVTILDQPMHSSTGIWLPIKPTAKEVRYIPAEAVKASPAVTVNNVPPPTTQTVSSGMRPTPPGTVPGQPAVTVAPGSGGGWQPAGQSQSAKPGSTTTLYGTGPPAHNPLPPSSPPQWSVWGTLRKSSFKKNGLDVFVLENSRGQPLLYATAQPGFSLNGYIGRTVSLYGGVSYYSDEVIRTYCMTATHVAVP